MAGLDHFNPTLTPVGFYMKTERHEGQMCDTCTYHGSYDWGWENCECPPDPLLSLYYLDVTIDLPVTKKPSSTMYRVRVYEKDYVRMSELETITHTLTDADLQVSFVVEATENLRDLEPMYGEFIELSGTLTPYTGSWKAPAPRASYAHDITDRLYAMCESEPDPNERDMPECAHVKRRKKGYSHAK